jgi:hypothetical protein
MRLQRVSLFFLNFACLFCFSQGFASPRITLESEPAQGQWSVLMDGKEILTYCYGENVDLPHYWPLRSPSGKNMLIQKTDPYPHHRALWFADTVQTKDSGRKISLYNALYTGQKDPNAPKSHPLPPYKDHIRHQKIITKALNDTQAIVEKTLIWEYDFNKPLFDEHRKIRLKALNQGEYLMDMTFTLHANYCDVDFVSDWVHYGWPYLRINPIFSGDQGGTITSDTGATGQEATNNKVAQWIDYSNTIEGVTEGLTVFQWPDGKDHRWLTREYGTFGPRRADDQSGKKFTLKKGQSISQRIGILVHKGDVKSGKSAERYEQFIAGKL